MTWAVSVKPEFTERIQFTRNVGKYVRMRSQCVPGSLKLQKSLGTRLALCLWCTLYSEGESWPAIYLHANAIMLARAVLFLILSSLPPDHHRLTWLLKSGKLRCANVSYSIMQLYSVGIAKLFS